MTVFGIDVSHHQPPLSFHALRQAGVEFVFIKATEGSTFVDPEFARNLAEARAAGLLVAAYHYVREAATATQQLANVRRVVSRDVPIVLDVEAGSGGVAAVRNLVDTLRLDGYLVPLLYLPRWYWQQLGSPSLVGLPPLWSSRYPDNVVQDLSREWAAVPASYWNGYGGLEVAVLQFTSSARVAGFAPLDANAFRGTREQLAKLLGYQEENEHMRNLILAREVDGPKVWVGDGIARRHVADETELAGLQWWIGQQGGDPTVNENFEDLRVLGVDVTAVGVTGGPAAVLAQIAADVTELKARPVADVDEEALAATLAELDIVGPTVPEIIAAIRTVFADAGAEDDPEVA